MNSIAPTTSISPVHATARRSTVRRVAPLLALLLSGACALPAYADCGASNTPSKARASFARGQAAEKAGNPRDAVAAYVAAQEATCEANPVAAPAAKRAAELAKPLAQAAERAGDLATAYRLYEDGAWFADADRVLIAQVRAKVDDVSLWETARGHFENRALASFQANEQLRLGVTGAYAPNATLLAEVRAMPAKRHAAVFVRENAAFDEKYLQALVNLAKTMPEDPTDAAAVARAQQAAVDAARRWPNDPLKTSRSLLQLARDWSVRMPEPEHASLEAQTRARLEQRAATLTTAYSGAPKALEAAIDYHGMATFGDPAQFEPRAAKVKAQAMQLGGAAERANRFGLASEYYDVAGESDRADAARDKQRRLAMAKMQPQIDAAQRQAEAIAKRFGDPAQVEAMKRQAEAAKAAMEQQKAQGKKSQANNDAFARELGM
jgi:hypothetical protein